MLHSPAVYFEAQVLELMKSVDHDASITCFEYFFSSTVLGLYNDHKQGFFEFIFKTHHDQATSLNYFTLEKRQEVNESESNDFLKSSNEELLSSLMSFVQHDPQCKKLFQCYQKRFDLLSSLKSNNSVIDKLYGELQKNMFCQTN